MRGNYSGSFKYYNGLRYTNYIGSPGMCQPPRSYTMYPRFTGKNQPSMNIRISLSLIQHQHSISVENIDWNIVRVIRQRISIIMTSSMHQAASSRIGVWIRIDHSPRSELECSIQNSSTYVANDWIDFIVKSRKFESIHNVNIHARNLNYLSISNNEKRWTMAKYVYFPRWRIASCFA